MNRLIRNGAIIGAGLIGMFWLARTGDGLNRLATDLQVVINLKPSWADKRLDFVVEFRNPVSQGISIKQPTVVVNHNGKRVASSRPSNAIIQIPANGVAETRLALDLEWGALLASAPAILLKQPITLVVDVFSSVVSSIGPIDIKRTQEFRVVN